jgi:hypothetical protein
MAGIEALFLSGAAMFVVEIAGMVGAVLATVCILLERSARKRRHEKFTC